MNARTLILLTTLAFSTPALAAESGAQPLNPHLKHHAWQLGTWMAKGGNGNHWVISFATALDGNAILLDGRQIDPRGATVGSVHAVRSYDPARKALVTQFKAADTEPAWHNVGTIKPGVTSFRRTTVDEEGQIQTHLTVDKEIDAETYHNFGVTVDAGGNATSRDPWEHRRVTRIVRAIDHVRGNAEAYVLNLAANPYQFRPEQWAASDLEMVVPLLSHAIHSHPNNARLRSARAKIHLLLNQWELAAKDYLKFSELDEKGFNDGHHASLTWMDGAAAQAQTGDIPAYQTYVARMLNRFGGSLNLMTVERIAKSALFFEPAKVDLRKAGVLADRSLKFEWPHARFVKGLVEFRSGRLASAAGFVDECLSRAPKQQPFLSIQANFLGALIAKAQGNEGKRQSHQAKAERSMKDRAYGWFHNKVICEALLKESKGGR